MKCPKCKKNIRGANKHKVKGIWYHKVCPKEPNVLSLALMNKMKVKQILKKQGVELLAHSKPAKFRMIRLRKGKTHNKVIR